MDGSPYSFDVVEMAMVARSRASVPHEQRDELKQALADSLAETELYRLGWQALCSLPGLAALPELPALLAALPACALEGPGRHLLLQSSRWQRVPVVWCFRCGAYASAMAAKLLFPCLWPAP